MAANDECNKGVKCDLLRNYWKKVEGGKLFRRFLKIVALPSDQNEPHSYHEHVSFVFE